MGEEHDDFTSEVISRLSGRDKPYSRYKLEGEVARGGQGAIVRVYDEDLQRNLAMKVVLGRTESSDDTPKVDSKTLGRFLEEAQVTAQLDHPGIVPVHELGLDPSGQVYFTMKLVKGEDLRSIFEKVRDAQEGWTITRALNVLLKVCEAMAYAHSKGVIHRDLKPGNIMVGRFGEVYVMDWGLARILDQEDRKDIRIQPPVATAEVHSARKAGSPADSPLITMDGDVVGTPAYMSPEQARGDLDQLGSHSDVYAVGAMLYHLLAGHMPYVPLGARLNNYAVWSHVQSGPPTPLDKISGEVPAELTAICEKAMAREPDRRYADTEALAADLAAFQEGRVVRAYETGSAAELRKWVLRNRSLSFASIGGVLALLVGFALALVEKNKAEVLAVVAAERGDRLEGANASLMQAKDALMLRLSPEEDELAEAFLRMSERILSGEATEQDRHQFALAYLRPRLSADPVQSFGEAAFRFLVAVKAAGASPELGVGILPELTVDGVPFEDFNGEAGAFFSGEVRGGSILEGAFESTCLATHEIAGRLKVFFGRSREHGHYHRGGLDSQDLLDQLDLLGEPLWLSLESLSITVMEKAPDFAKRAVFTGPLPTAYLKRIRVYGDLTRSDDEWTTIVLELPPPPVMFACRVHLRTEEEWVSSALFLGESESELPVELLVEPALGEVPVLYRMGWSGRPGPIRRDLQEEGLLYWEHSGSSTWRDVASLTFRIRRQPDEVRIVIKHDQGALERWLNPGWRMEEVSVYGKVDLVLPVTEWR